MDYKKNLINFEQTNEMITDFTEIPVWTKAMVIAEKTFLISENLPRKEDYTLTFNIKRSAESISSNIAESFGKKTSKDKSHFYTIARGFCT
jgi:four helix bundle protein